MNEQEPGNVPNSTPTPATTPPAPPAPPAPPTPPQAWSPEPSQNGGGSNKLLIGIIVAIVALILLGGIAYAYTTYLAPSGGGIGSKLSVEQLLSKSMKKMATVDSFVMSFSVNGDIKDLNNTPQSTFSISVDGPIKISKADKKVVFDFSNKIKVDLTSASSSGGANLGIGTRFVDEKLFVNFSDMSLTYVPVDPREAMSAAMITGMVTGFSEQLKGKWISFEDLQKEAKNITSKNKESSDLMKKYFDKGNFETVMSDVEEADLNGMPTYKFTVSTKGSQSLIDLIQKSIAEDLTLSQMQKIEVTSKMGQMEDLLSKGISFDVWIGKSDLYTHKVAFSKMTVEDKESNTKSGIQFTMNFSGFNQPVNVVAPVGAIKFEELMSDVFGGGLIPAVPQTPAKKPVAPVKK